jgi:hypothetical protein
MQRLILRKNKKDIPKLSKCKYYIQYKIYEGMSRDELVVLIGNKRRDCSFCKDKKELQKIKTEIRLLEDLYTLEVLEGINLFNKYRNEENEILFTTELSIEASSILAYLGYKSPIYIDECIKLSERIDKGDILRDIRLEVAVALVKEILEHYEAIFNEDKVIADYGIDENKLYKYYYSIHRWCKQHYWKR